MSTQKVSILVDLAGNLSERAARYGRSLSDLSRTGQRSMNALARGVRQASGQLDQWGNRAALAGAAGAYGFKKLFVGTAAEFERFQAILETIEGSAIKAQSSLGWVTNFAAKTPYELAEVTSAFVKLKSYGIDPQSGALSAAGDAAAALGKPLEQAVEALADAMTGENERLKEFGITARTVGNKIVYRWQQDGKTMTASAKKNSQSQIQSVLTSIWNGRYKGAMDKLSSTWEGMTSNLGDNWTVFTKDVMDSGAFEILKGELKSLLDEIDRMKETGEYDELVKTVGTNLVEAFKSIRETAVEVKNTAKELQPLLESIGTAVKFISESAGGTANLVKWLAILYLVNKALRFAGPAGGMVAKGGWSAAKRVDQWVRGGRDNSKLGGSRAPGPAGARGAGAGGGLLGRGGAVPVYLVDGPMSVIPDRSTPTGTPDGKSEGKPGERKPGSRRRGGSRRNGALARVGDFAADTGRGALNAGKHVVRAGAPLAIVGGAIDAGSVLLSDAPVDEKVSGVSSAVGGAAGAWAGAAAGAAIGSIVPVVGTAIGGILGGTLGYFLGEIAGEKAGDAINSTLDLKVKVEGPPGTTARVESMSATGTELDAQVYNGFGMMPR
jgi:phage tail tape-measure protein